MLRWTGGQAASLLKGSAKGSCPTPNSSCWHLEGGSHLLRLVMSPLILEAQMQLPSMGTWRPAELAEKCCRVAHKKGQEFFETPTGELSEECKPRIETQVASEEAQSALGS